MIRIESRTGMGPLMLDPDHGETPWRPEDQGGNSGNKVKRPEGPKKPGTGKRSPIL